MKRVVLNVATGRYLTGQKRLLNGIGQHSPGTWCMFWGNDLPLGSPEHIDIPFAFKAFAIDIARKNGEDLILWADASIVPIRPLEPLWERIERDGYWVSRNGWQNGEWCADAALPLMGMTREESLTHPHIVATAFGLNLRSEIGQRFADEYLRLAQNGAFRGPWWNRNNPAYRDYPEHYRGHIWCAPCGDERVLGHRHDQTAASMLAWRLGMTLTDAPTWFAYRGGETENTLLVADGIA